MTAPDDLPWSRPDADPLGDMRRLWRESRDWERGEEGRRARARMQRWEDAEAAKVGLGRLVGAAPGVGAIFAAIRCQRCGEKLEWAPGLQAWTVTGRDDGSTYCSADVLGGWVPHDPVG